MSNSLLTSSGYARIKTNDTKDESCGTSSTSNNANSNTSTTNNTPNNMNNNSNANSNINTITQNKAVKEQLEQIEYNQISKINFFKNDTSANCVIIKQDLDPRNIRNVVKKYFSANSQFINTKKKPGAIISVTGGAQYYEIRSLKLERIIKRGFLQAARNLGAWIVDGGMNAGVMKYIGKSIKSMSVTHIPCIGVATYRRVTNFDSLRTASNGLQYDSESTMGSSDGSSCGLDPNHTHFVLVDSGKDTEWGDEIDMLTEVQSRLALTIPLVIISFNGGKGTLEVIAKGLRHDSPVIVIQSTGRISDAVAELVTFVKTHHIAQPSCAALEQTNQEFPSWKKFIQGFKKKEAEAIIKTMDTVLQNHRYITVFDPNDEEEEGLDIIILRNVVAQEKSLLKKLNHCIAWGDGCDMMREILEDSAIDPTRKKELSEALDNALAEALWLNRPNIFGMLCDYHAAFPHALRYLYRHPLVLDQLKRGHVWLTRRWYYWPNHFRDLWVTWWSSSSHDVVTVTQKPPRLRKIMDLLSQVGPAFHGYAKRFDSRYFNADNHPELNCTFTDLLIWAVFVNRFDLAKQIWRRTTYPVHSALLASSLYRYLAAKAIRTQEYIDNSNWFEQQASDIMTLLNYQEAEKLLEHPWESITGRHITLEHIAVEGECKEFMSHPHYQQMLDEMLYSYKGKSITTSKSNTHIIGTIIFTFILWIPLYFANSYKKNVSDPKPNKDGKIVDKQSAPENAPIATTTPAKSETNNNNTTNTKLNHSNSSNNSKPGGRRATISISAPPQKLVLPTSLSLSNLSSPPISFFVPPESKKGKEKAAQGNEIQKEPSLLEMSLDEREQLDEEEKQLDQMEKDNPDSQDELLQIYPPIYFNIPIVKFWTNAIFYCAFLFLQAYIVVTLHDEPITIPEYVLWGWIFSFFILEVQQFHQQHGYFSHFSNKIDNVIIVMHLVYAVLRITHQITGDARQLSGAMNTLIVACVFSWLRLMAIFPVSSTFGPLFFILAKLFTRDFVLWVVLFAIFAVSFQIGFSSIARQANLDPLIPYPNEDGTFPITYFSILGDFSYLMPDFAGTPIGVAFLGIYTFIAQVMLVNLLIAMMGDTYTTVRQNSDVEWKCYRRVFVRENKMAPALPPPLNLLWYMYQPLKKLMKYLKDCCISPSEKRRRNIMEMNIHESPRPHVSTKSIGIADSQDPNSPSFSDPSSRELGPLQAQLIDSELDEAEDIAKVMRVTLDKIAEKSEREESESPLTQIKQVKKVLLDEANSEKSLETKFEQLQQLMEQRGIDSGAVDVRKKIAELDGNLLSLHEAVNEKLADQTQLIQSLERQLQTTNDLLRTLFPPSSLPLLPSVSHPAHLSTHPLSTLHPAPPLRVSPPAQTSLYRSGSPPLIPTLPPPPHAMRHVSPSVTPHSTPPVTPDPHFPLHPPFGP